MMRMVSNVKVGPHANDIKEDQRDENGGNADQDFGDDIRVNGMMMMGWIIKMQKGLKYFFSFLFTFFKVATFLGCMTGAHL